MHCIFKRANDKAREEHRPQTTPACGIPS
jgi:hypothetical protein